MASKLETEQLRVFFLPFLAAGHMIPMVDLARLLAMHGVAVTIVTTTANALIFQNSVDRDINSGHQIRIHALQFPSSEVGLSAGVENLNAASSFEHSVGINKALAMLRVPVETLFREERPDCIVSDLLYPWTTDVAAELGIPRIFFNGSSFFWFCAERSLHETKTDCSEDDAVLLSGLPHKIELLRSQIPDWMKTTDSKYALFNALRESESKIYGAVMNSFDELEPAYVAHFRNTMKMEAWSVGPVSLWLNRDNLPDVGKTTVNNADQAHDDHKEILNWLNSKEHNSVIYVSFGSLARFRSTQLKEISHGLEASGHPFIWVVKKTENEDYNEIFPEGFEQRIKQNNKGFVVRDWAPQTLILNHPATGAMVTHCGWNSIIEAVAAGKPMITWPLSAEQFCNEKLVTDVLRIGVAVDVRKWSFDVWQLGKELVKREQLEKAAEFLMGGGGGGEEAADMRKRVRNLAEDAKKAMETGGSSQTNLMALINELKSLKNLKDT